METTTICTTLSEEDFDREVAELDITRCSFCFVKLEKEIEIYGEKDFPLCQKCHLEGVQPDEVLPEISQFIKDLEIDADGNKEEILDQLKAMKKKSESKIEDLQDEIRWTNSEIWDLEQQLDDYTAHLEKEKVRNTSLDSYIDRLRRDLI